MVQRALRSIWLICDHLEDHEERPQASSAGLLPFHSKREQPYVSMAYPAALDGDPLT